MVSLDTTPGRATGPGGDDGTVIGQFTHQATNIITVIATMDIASGPGGGDTPCRMPAHQAADAASSCTAMDIAAGPGCGDAALLRPAHQATDV